MHLVELEAGKNLLQQIIANLQSLDQLVSICFHIWQQNVYIYMQRCGYEDKLVKQNDVK